MPVSLAEWIGLLRKEYLAEFIPSGGAAVKLAVVSSDRIAQVLEAIEREAAEQGYRVARIDAAQTRVHMIDRLFYAVAHHVDWDAGTDRYLRALLRRHGIQVDDDCSLQDIDAIAEANGRQRSDLYGEIGRLIT